MSDYRGGEPIRETRRSGGTTIIVILVAIAVIVGVLFATGFWSANVTKKGSLPEVVVKGGALPKVDMDSKEVVVGTSKTKVEVPKVKTETETVDVPTIGVKDNGGK
jgi:beta-lactam-binding protein with PASTA domain